MIQPRHQHGEHLIHTYRVPMPFLTTNERTLLQTMAALGYCNPFLPERVDYERAILGDDFIEGEPVWSMQVDAPDAPRANAERVAKRVEALVGALRERLERGTTVNE